MMRGSTVEPILTQISSLWVCLCKTLLVSLWADPSVLSSPVCPRSVPRHLCPSCLCPPPQRRTRRRTLLPRPPPASGLSACRPPASRVPSSADAASSSPSASACVAHGRQQRARSGPTPAGRDSSAGPGGQRGQQCKQLCGDKCLKSLPRVAGFISLP